MATVGGKLLASGAACTSAKSTTGMIASIGTPSS
jgi:hypothetical protein